MQRLGLTEAEIDDLVSFMGSVTSAKFAAFGKQEMARQQAKKTVRPERDTAVATGKRGDLGDLRRRRTRRSRRRSACSCGRGRRMTRGFKGIETKHYEERDAFFAGLARVSRRSFLKPPACRRGIALGRDS